MIIFGIAIPKATTAVLSPSFLLIILNGLSTLNILKIFKLDASLNDANYIKVKVDYLTEKMTITKSSIFQRFLI